LYRVVGVTSKVTKLVTHGLDKKKMEKLNFDDIMEVESKTVYNFDKKLSKYCMSISIFTCNVVTVIIFLDIFLLPDNKCG
jgi:hypothetical protein